jgi:hypothetical protein
MLEDFFLELVRMYSYSPQIICVEVNYDKH